VIDTFQEEAIERAMRELCDDGNRDVLAPSALDQHCIYCGHIKRFEHSAPRTYICHDCFTARSGEPPLKKRHE